MTSFCQKARCGCQWIEKKNIVVVYSEPSSAKAEGYHLINLQAETFVCGTKWLQLIVGSFCCGHLTTTLPWGRGTVMICYALEFSAYVVITFSCKTCVKITYSCDVGKNLKIGIFSSKIYVICGHTLIILI